MISHAAHAPGFVLSVRFAGGAEPEQRVRATVDAIAQSLSANTRFDIDVVRDSHLVCAVGVDATAHPTRADVWSDEYALTAVHGYVTNLPAETTGKDNAASRVSRVYQQRGTAGIESLDGAFVIAILDRADRTLTLWSDCVGGRPMFLAEIPDGVAVGPELKCFMGLPGVQQDLVPGSLASMALNASLLGRHTYIKGVEFIGPARRVSVSRDGLRSHQYWSRQFACAESAPSPSVETVGEILVRSIARRAAAFERPILALSGGLDSRLILAAANEAGLELPCVTWGYDHIDADGSDYRVADEAARIEGTSHRTRRIDVDQLPLHAARVVHLTDGLTGHLGHFPEGDTVARELSADHDAILFGDESFGWGKSVHSTAAALSEVGVHGGSRLRLLRFLLNKDVAQRVLNDYDNQTESLLSSLDPSACPNDVVDILYWQNRYPRFLTSVSPVYDRHLACVSPLMDREILDFTAQIPPVMRIRKRYMAQCVRRRFPHQFSIPLNNVHSRTDWRRRLSELGPTPRYMVETLLEPDVRFDEWFDRDAMQAWLGMLTASGRSGAWASGASWWTRVTHRARARLLRPVSRTRMIVSLLVLKLWFHAFRR